MAQPIDSDTLKLRALTPEHQLNQFLSTKRSQFASCDTKSQKIIKTFLRMSMEQIYSTLN